jgi:hypothetical protein
MAAGLLVVAVSVAPVVAVVAVVVVVDWRCPSPGRRFRRICDGDKEMDSSSSS